MLKTILFDLDGTLIPFVQDDFIRAYFKHLVERIAPMGYDGEKIIAALWKGTGAMLKNDGTFTNRQVFWNRFAQELGMGVLSLEGILDDFYSQEFNAVSATLKEHVDRGPMIRALREKGYSLVLATNPIFPAVAVETRLKWIGLKPENFDYVTTYENSRHSKPNPNYYRDILDQIGQKPEDCLMIGNNPSDDMSALQLGIDGILVTDYLENELNLPIDRYDCRSFKELDAYLSALPHTAE